MVREIDRPNGAEPAVLLALRRSIVVKRVYRWIFVPTLTHGHEPWVVTKRMSSLVKVTEISYLRRVVGSPLEIE